MEHHFSNETRRGQNHDLDLGEMVKEHAIRIRVHHDTSYAHQSHAHAEVWSPATLSWNETARLLPLEVHEAWEAADELRARTAALLVD